MNKKRPKIQLSCVILDAGVEEDNFIVKDNYQDTKKRDAR